MRVLANVDLSTIADAKAEAKKDVQLSIKLASSNHKKLLNKHMAAVIELFSWFPLQAVSAHAHSGVGAHRHPLLLHVFVAVQDKWVVCAVAPELLLDIRISQLD